MKRSLFILSFFGVSLFVLMFALYANYEIGRTKQLKTLLTYYQNTNDARYGIFSSLVPASGDILSAVVVSDARPTILDAFFRSYDSPLRQYAAYFVASADKYGLDYRLLPAIAMQESSGGRVIPDESYNAWGFAINESETLRFTSWEQAIDAVARGLKRGYINQGFVTPEQIMTKYTPASLAKGGAWAKGVRYFMEQMP